jgi:mannose/fructose-specific phosphotransferase system component IIA
MSLGTLNRYLRRQAAGGKGNGELVAVELGGGKVSGSLVAILSGGRKIEVEAGVDGPTLERLVRALESM